MDASARSCPICEHPLERGGTEWLQHCPHCDFLASTLEPCIEIDPGLSAIDEDHRFQALAPLRRANHDRIVRLLQTIGPARERRLLDVGCGHGWFLNAAAAGGFVVHGLEPDAAMSRLAAKSGYRVWTGYFPADLPADARFDVLVFNDVFEHLPDIRSAMQACQRVLAPGGILVINLPVHTGVFYRLASALHSVGIRKPLERMWQKGFPSPHLSYFRRRHLRSLALGQGFQFLSQASLPSLQRQGLWHRLRYDRTGSWMAAAIQFCGILLSLPVLRLLPADINVLFFRIPAVDGSTASPRTA